LLPVALHVPMLLHANVPVWLYWGTTHVPLHVKHQVASLYFPNSLQIKDALLRQDFPNIHESESSIVAHEQHPSPSLGHPNPPPLSPLPPWPPPHSCQHFGETWQQYFTRAESSRVAKITIETDDERIKQENMEQDAAKHPIPRHCGPRVFHWDAVDAFCLHTNVARSQVEDMWDMYSSSQQRFDSFHNE
jgi:hypothetical protein